MDNKKLLAAKELRDKRIAKLESLNSISNLADILIFIACILINIEFKLNTTRNAVSASAEAKASERSPEEVKPRARYLIEDFYYPDEWERLTK